MAQLAGFEDPLSPHFVCKLNKALYGMKQAPKAWFARLRSTHLQKGFQNSASDSLFYSNINGRLIFILVYVDDIMITGDNSTTIRTLIHDLNTDFALKTLRSMHYFLGFEVIRTPSVLHLCQTMYASDLLQKTNMSNVKPSSTPMHLGNKFSLNGSPFFSQPSLYRSTIGALQYLTHTRPNISYAVNKLSQFLHAPTIVHWVACKRILRYIKGTLTHGLSFKSTSVLSLEGFSDADWATNLDDRKSMSGLCIFLGSDIITWSSKKQNAIARSSTESEYRALASTATVLVWIQNSSWTLVFLFNYHLQSFGVILLELKPLPPTQSIMQEPSTSN